MAAIPHTGRIVSPKTAVLFPLERTAPEESDNGDMPMRIHTTINERTVRRTFREQ